MMLMVLLMVTVIYTDYVGVGEAENLTGAAREIELRLLRRSRGIKAGCFDANEGSGSGAYGVSILGGSVIEGTAV